MNNNITYLTTNQLIEKAKDKIIALPTQERAQIELATIFSMQTNKIKAIENGVPADELPSLSSFIIGGSGSGKSHITQNLAKSCGLNFARIDCANITSSGYKGRNISNAFSGILESNPNFFDSAIVLFDEADKMRMSGENPHHDATSAQKDFLMLLEGGDYTFSSDDKKDITINLDKTLFLFSGACAKLGPQLARRYKKKNTLGFLNETKITDEETLVEPLSKVTLEDLKSYGFMPEIVGRLKQIIYIPDIDLEGYKILVNSEVKTSAVNKYKHIFETRGVEFKITNSACNLIAERALKEGLGARSIEGVLNKAIFDAHNHVDTHPKINTVILTTKDGEFKLNYHNGERIYKALPTVPQIISDDDLNIDIAQEIRNKLALHNFCSKMCEFANLSNKYQEELFFNFLHTTCYFLANATRKSERSILNIKKLAEATDCTKRENSDAISPYEIICNDFLAAEHSKDEQLGLEDGFLPYYVQFKKLSCGLNVSNIIIEALNTATIPYLKSKTVVQESA